MKITDADHTNWRVKEIERSLRFYRDVLGLEPFGLDEYERGEHPLVSLRITPGFILHLRPDPTRACLHWGLRSPRPCGRRYGPRCAGRSLTEAGVEIESRAENVIGARGSGEALYVRDPDGYLIELSLRCRVRDYSRSMVQARAMRNGLLELVLVVNDVRTSPKPRREAVV